jgi:hypothetical protein
VLALAVLVLVFFPPAPPVVALPLVLCRVVVLFPPSVLAFPLVPAPLLALLLALVLSLS